MEVLQIGRGPVLSHCAGDIFSAAIAGEENLLTAKQSESSVSCTERYYALPDRRNKRIVLLRICR